MTNAVTTFNFAHGNVEQGIRTVTLEGNPWFITGDICEALALRPHPKGGFSNQTQRIADDRKAVLWRRDGHPLFQAGGVSPRVSMVSVVSEAGLYDLILRSSLPSALAFKEWITGVVLPAIRKNGGYVLGQGKVATGELTLDDYFARARAMMESTVADLRKELEETRSGAA